MALAVSEHQHLVLIYLALAKLCGCDLSRLRKSGKSPMAHSRTLNNAIRDVTPCFPDRARSLGRVPSIRHSYLNQAGHSSFLLSRPRACRLH